MAKQAKIKEESQKQWKRPANKTLDEVIEKGSMLKLMVGINKDLIIKLEMSSWEKSWIEAQLQKAMCTKTEMARQMEQTRCYRDMLLQMIKYYKDREALAAIGDSGYEHREFITDKINNISFNI